MGRPRSDAKKARGKGVAKKKVDHKALMAAEMLHLPAALTEADCWKAYHLNGRKCDQHVPPLPRLLNCKEKPYCIQRLGFEKLDKLKKDRKEDPYGQAIQKRNTDNQPCGLVNFGNFCYVNSFLQLWYNDLVFRQCIYDWEPSPDFDKPEDAKMDVQAVMNELQRLFLAMQITPFETASPLPWIRLLRLDNEQNDVGEFNTVFFDALDRNLRFHPNGGPVWEVIRERFESAIESKISCDSCNNVSEPATAVYRSLQLVIDGAKTLTEALNMFLMPEELSEYKCSNCGNRVSATRISRFSQLPPVLIILLNRYIYDGSGRHKKLKTPIRYPRTLMERALQGDAPTNRTYNLCAVMIHEGQNTHCGHYYDIILDPVTRKWHTYNDRDVTETKQPGVAADKEEGTAAQQKTKSGTADMKGCYALIYRREDADNEITLRTLRPPPEAVVNEVKNRLEADFERETREGNKSMRLWYEQIGKRHRFLKEMWEQLEVDNGEELLKSPEELIFLPTSLLKEILLREFSAVEKMKSLEQVAFDAENAAKEEHMGGESSKNDSQLANQQHEDEHGSLMEVDQPEEIAESELSASQANKHGEAEDPSEIYKLAPITNQDMDLCIHEKVPLGGVLRGEIRAVHKLAAERLLSSYELKPRLINWKKVDVKTNCWEPCRHNYGTSRDHLRTGRDICVECVELKRKEALFRQELEGIDDLLDRLHRAMKQRTHSPNGPKPPAIPPPPGAVWVSEKHLKSFKRIALEQMEYLMENSRRFWLQLSFSSQKQSPRKELANGKDTDKTTANEASVIEKKRLRLDSHAADQPSCSYSNLPSNYSPAPRSQLHGSTLKGRTFASGPPRGEMKDGDEDDEEEEDQEEEEEEAMEIEPSGPMRNGHVPTPPGSTVSSKEENDVGMTDDEAQQDGVDLGHKQQEDGYPTRFNDELRCGHGNLTYKVRRVWLTREEWNSLIAIYQSLAEGGDEDFSFYSPGIPCTEPECHLCIDDYMDVEERKMTYKQMLDDLKASIGKLLKVLEKRKHWQAEEIGLVYNRLLCPYFFLYMYQRIIKSKTSSDTDLPSFCQECLLCEHQKPYRVLSAGDKWAGIPLTYDEWKTLTGAFARLLPNAPRPTEIKLVAQTGSYETFCEDCADKFFQEEEDKKYIYTDAYIYVKLKEDDKDKNKSATIRTRRTATKQLMKFQMSSTDKVLDLKLHIYQRINQTPADQLLYRNEACLENEQTLAEARVEANNQEDPLILIVQQTTSDTSGGSGEPRQLEKGFKDTALST